MPQRSFVRGPLPWVIAAVMLIFYLVTLDKVVTVQSAAPLARVTGTYWHPIYTAPLNWLVTLPLRALPSGAQLLGLNFIAALCAALSLALLARCVAILPHERTQLQRNKLAEGDPFLSIRLAWVPVLFAVLVCGLQRSFWEHAIVGTGEALDLLLFAYCVRCVLEFRLDEKHSWLNRLAVVYALGITNNFAMIAFLPVLLIVLVWIKGMRFFRFDFLSRMFLLGLAGLSLYLLLPLVQMQSDVAPITFWQALKANLVFQKRHLLYSLPRYRVVWLGIYALLPLLQAGVRWPSSFGDTSPVGSVFANIFAQIMHAGLLVFSLYMVFDPPAAPREFGLGLTYLPCYFLGALSVGYYTGFLLLVFSEGDRERRHSNVPTIVNQAMTALLCAGALFVAGRLAMQNYPKMREATSHALHDYVRLLAKSLPEKPCVVLSDDPIQLHALGGVLGRAGLTKYLLLDTASLGEPSFNHAYHNFLRQRYGERCPKLALEKGNVGFNAPQIMQFLADLGRSNELFYLHPSWGFFFETYYLEPSQFIYKLKPYLADGVEVPVPSAALIAQQTSKWKELAGGTLREIKTAQAQIPTDPFQRFSYGTVIVAGYYSRAMNWWGVELQRAGRAEDAARFFAEALAVNPDNASALVNRDANALTRAGKKNQTELTREQKEKLQLYRGIEGLLNACGPVDQPDFDIEFAQVFLQRELYRQAEQLVQRAAILAPDNLLHQIALAGIELQWQKPDRALAQIRRVRPLARTAAPALRIELDRVEAFARYAQTNFAEAEKILRGTISNFPGEDASHNVLSQLFVTDAMHLRANTNDHAANVQLTNAVHVIDAQLNAQPQNAAAHFNHGNLLMFISDLDGAIQDFTKVLQLEKENPAALLNRAVCYLQSKKFSEANRDYHELLSRHTTTSFQVYYGLGEVAYQQKDWKAAKEYYQLYLRYAPPNAAEAQTIRKRLEEVRKK